MGDHLLHHLHEYLWNFEGVRDKSDLQYESKVKNLSWVQPKHLEVPEWERSLLPSMSAIVVSKLRLINHQKSPLSKLSALCRSILFLSASYELAYAEKSTKASADFLLPALISLLIKA